MKIECPHCNRPIEIVADHSHSSSACPLCGSNLELVEEDTLSFQPTSRSTLDGFRLLHRLGQGHFGEIWKAHDNKLDRDVAIKVPRLSDLDGETTASFIREAQAAARLRHPNIVAVHDVIVGDGGMFIVSDLIDGVSLAEVLRVRKFSPKESAILCATIADAIEHAHQNGIIHRDLKPSNVIMSADDTPHLTDFGLAKKEGDTITIAVDGQILGTPAYMSPEAARGDGHNADARSDVYSLGVVLYELITHRRPFLGGSSLLLHQVIHSEPEAPRSINRGLPRDLETICLKCIAKEPSRRYPTASALAADLRRYVNGEPIHARPISMVERMWNRCKHHPARVALGMASAVAILAIVAAFDARQGRELAQKESRVSSTTAGKAKADVEAMKNQIDKLTPMQRVTIATEPAGGKIIMYPYLRTMEVDLEHPVHVTNPIAEVASGRYFVVAVGNDGAFHEVLRYVPFDREEIAEVTYSHKRYSWTDSGVVQLPSIKLFEQSAVTRGMASVEGNGRFSMGEGSERHFRSTPAYFLDTHEVTVREFRENWKAFPRLKEIDGDDDFPITNITWDDATAFAEKVGKTLADEPQLLYAATNFGKSKHPWGDEDRADLNHDIQSVHTETFDIVASSPSIKNLASNALEWTASYPTLINYHLPIEIAQNHYVVVGGPPKVLGGKSDSIQRFAHKSDFRHPLLGFRMSRSTIPRTSVKQFGRPLRSGD